ncbi:MAG: CDP-diacylglycerol--glycerol-3-phosphate 3-phosphatidyltransferase [Melioribacteraceae bacterium]|nr:CDP-diacylglycerol--glycerol-3-phosphate 3-phosphatidyltransferase [Melioribacteraceae bacterium]
MILPNQLTTLRIILTPVFLVLFIMDDPLCKQISVAVFVLAALTDWYDGWLARKFNYITAWGKFMDPLADKILTSTAFFAFAAIGILELWMVVIIVLRDLIVTGLRLYAEFKKKSFTTSLLAKWKTMIQMAFLYLLLLIYVATTFDYFYSGNESLFETILYSDYTYYSMLFVTLFTLITGITYLYSNRLLIKNLIKFED